MIISPHKKPIVHLFISEVYQTVNILIQYLTFILRFLQQNNKSAAMILPSPNTPLQIAGEEYGVKK
jgi:hypothetical protein